MTQTDLSLSYGDYLRFKDMVHQQSGLNFPEQKMRELELGLTKALKTLPASVAEACHPLSYSAYADFLSDKKSIQAQLEMARLINLLTIGETHFFRNNAHFNALAQYILPELISRKREDALAVGQNAVPPQLRIWSAGCASGEEPYSLAILLRQLIPDIEDWRILILATDINQDSLKKAKQASYSEWSFREPQAKAAQSIYFNKQNKRYQLHQNIREMVTFTPLNLIEDPFPAIHNNTLAMDLIMCRNVTIYFNEETTRTLINKFHQSLLKGGWLVVGHSEPALGLYEAFNAHTFHNAIIYQKPTEAHPPLVAESAFKPQPVNRPNLQIPLNGSTLVPPLKQPGQNTQALASPIIKTSPLEQAQTLLQQKQAEKAIEILSANWDNIPKTEGDSARCLMAQAYIQTEVWEQARQWAEKALKQNTLLAKGYALLALIDEQEGDLEAAIKNLKTVIYLEPKAPLPHFNLALLYQKNNQPETALRSLNNSISILSGWLPETIVPGSGGSNAKRLLEIAKMLQISWQDNLKS